MGVVCSVEQLLGYYWISIELTLCISYTAKRQAVLVKISPQTGSWMRDLFTVLTFNSHRNIFPNTFSLLKPTKFTFSCHGLTCIKMQIPTVLQPYNGIKDSSNTENFGSNMERRKKRERRDRKQTAPATA